MAKSARASSRKANNQRLKKKVFSPVESARTERLSAKLLELAAQPKPERVTDRVAMEGVVTQDEDAVTHEADAVPAEDLKDDETMDIDPPSSKLASSRQKGKGKTRVEKRRVNRSSIVFPKYKERKSMKKK